MDGRPCAEFAKAKSSTCARSVPLDHCLGFHEDKHVGPSRPQPSQRHPEQSIGTSHAATPTTAGEDRELLPESQVLDHEISSRVERGADGAEEK
jgi:hypothetical protein